MEILVPWTHLTVLLRNTNLSVEDMMLLDFEFAGLIVLD